MLAARLGQATAADGTPVLHPDMTFSVVFGLLCLAALVIVAQAVLPIYGGPRGWSGRVSSRVSSLFQIPYISWYLLHSLIASIGIIAVVILGVDGIIDKGTVAALLGSLFGYIFGSVSRGQNGGGSKPDMAGVSKLIVDTSTTPPTVTLLGTNLDLVKAVSLGDIDIHPGDVNHVNSGALQFSVPPAPDPKNPPKGGAVKLTLLDGTVVTSSLTYTPS
jgi:hypothetical protein